MRAIVVGSANTDLIIHVDNLPDVGNTEIGTGFKNVPGGKGANQAVCLAKLGAETHLIARFGNDDFSSLLIENIRQSGISLSHAVIDERRRGGVVFILIDRTGNNTMIVDLGSNLYLDGHDVENAGNLFRGADLLLLQFEVSERANFEACAIAEQNNVKVVLNPAPMKDFDITIFKHIDVITPNLFELSQILKHAEGRDVISAGETEELKISEAARLLLRYGLNHVLITLGKRGSIYVNEDEVKYYGIYRVKQVDSTAASDVFTSAFAMKFAEGESIDEAVKFASAGAAITVTREGAIPSLPSRDEVEIFMKRNTYQGFE